MPMETRERIISLLSDEVTCVQDPVNRNERYVFEHIDELAETLIGFLEYRCGEELVEGVGSKVIGALSFFATPSLDTQVLPGAIEDLATGFESFVKKIAVIKYGKEPIKLRGDDVRYIGLLNTPLGSLLEGRVGKVNAHIGAIPPLYAPVVTFSYSGEGVRNSVYDQVRHLRNEIHISLEKSILELLRVFRIVAAAYIFATEENLRMLRELVDPIFSYALKLENSLRVWDCKYVDLVGEKVEGVLLDKWPDLQALEWRDEAEENTKQLFAWQNLEDLIKDENRQMQNPIRASAVELAENTQQLWLIGEPGAGKTTTLKRAAWLRSSQIISTGYLLEPCAVLIPANRFERGYGFRNIIADLLSIELEQVENVMRKGNIWVLIDGLNEIPAGERPIALKEIQRLIDTYSDLRIVLTSRKYGFERRLDIPVFELLPLNDEMIFEYLLSNMPTLSDANGLFGQLMTSGGLLIDFARNPLLLRMLMQVARAGKLPPNRGQLFRLFTSWIFSREQKQKRTNTLVKERVLSIVGFNILKTGRTYAPQPLVLKWMEESLSELGTHKDLAELLDELLDSGFFEIDAGGRISFFHELILEYFACVELQRKYICDGRLAKNYYLEAQWFEPVIMLSGLLENADALMGEILVENMILASRCIASGACIDSETISAVLDKCKDMLSHEKKERMKAILALLELGTMDSFRMVINEREYSLTAVLARCERPEMTTLRLLEFGLTGRHRIRQCLRVFESSPVSKAIINSSQVTKAERILLTGEIVGGDIILIDRIGVAEEVRNDFIAAVQGILRTGICSELWRIAACVSANQGFLEDCRDIILESISKLDQSEGQDYYSIYVACKLIGDFPLANQIALDATRMCMSKGLYGMAYKFMEGLQLGVSFDRKELFEHITRMSKAGQLQMLIYYAKLFGDIIDFYPFMDTAVDSLIESGNLFPIMQFRKSLVPILEKKGEELKSKLFNVIPAMRVATARKWVRLLGLENHFVGYGKVKLYFKTRGFGFIFDLSSNKEVFFHKSTVSNFDEICAPRARDNVRYTSEPSTKYPGLLSATSVLVDRLYDSKDNLIKGPGITK